jgi:hypothetical protein
MRDLASVAILTRAGISVESGLAALRGRTGRGRGQRVKDPERPRRSPLKACFDPLQTFVHSAWFHLSGKEAAS